MSFQANVATAHRRGLAVRPTSMEGVRAAELGCGPRHTRHGRHGRKDWTGQGDAIAELASNLGERISRHLPSRRLRGLWMN